ncbi:MAG: serine/threonine protein kinase [Planctomycetes bacterium]|nr:serine/threonine protein kinase [Planctomycetota bacterium]
MSDSRLERLRRLFDQVVDLPPAARPVFLDHKCGADDDLKQRLLAMLQAADAALVHTPPKAPEPLRDPEALSAAPVTVSSREGPGTQLGPYQLLQQIGEGGFGVVFLAEQLQPVARRVALKIVKLGMDTREVVARFEQERQALALMDHPNIARVLDAGVTATGRPFFVMDLVKGAPIGEYCDQNKLTVAERLELFAQVCGAVQHAHGKGIIHRDLKPSNILVGTQDGRPLVKIIDFGIAKAIAQRLTDKTLFTAHHQVVGTLQYMSPEQAEGSLDIDTRTDVYALGVILYELLTGSTPFDTRAMKDAMYGELQRMIRETDPPRPSTRLHESKATLASIAAHRRVDPTRLGTLLRGDLDWIVMKALEKDRVRRYETANALADDIRRHVAGDVVVAAPPRATYRLRKFVHRNRAFVAAAGAVVAALLIGAVGFAWQASVAQGERDTAVMAQRAEAAQRRIADEQRGLAERNQATADTINKFLLDMLGAADVRILGRDATVAQALDYAAAATQSAFVGRPEVEAAVRLILAETYASLGQLDAAEPQLEAALELNRRVHGESSAEYAQCVMGLAGLKLDRGDAAASAAQYAKATEIAAAAVGAEHATTLRMRTLHANALAELRRHVEAEQMLREVVGIRRRRPGLQGVDMQVALNSLAVLLNKLDRFDEAEELYREAVAVGERDLGARHPDTLTARLNLVNLRQRQGRNAADEQQMVVLVADMRRVFGPTHQRTGDAAKLLGEFYRRAGRFRDAVPLLEECLAIRVRSEGELTEGVADAKHSLALALRRLGEAERAATLQRDLIAIYARSRGADSEKALNSALNLANSLGAGSADEAEAIFKDVITRSVAALGEDNLVHVIANNSYGVFLMGKGRFAEAKQFVRRALEIGEEAEGADHENTLITRYNLANIERELGDLEAAERFGRECVDSFTRVFGPGHANTALAHSSMGHILAELRRTDEAQRHFELAIAISKKALGGENQGFCEHAIGLGRLLCDADRAGEAEPVLREAEAIYTKVRGPKDPRTAAVRIELGRCCQLLGRFAEGEPLLVEGHATLVATRPDGRADLRRAERYLAAGYAAWNTAEPDAERATKAAAWQARADAAR